VRRAIAARPILEEEEEARTVTRIAELVREEAA
jgi:hypothetical protein